MKIITVIFLSFVSIAASANSFCNQQKELLASQESTIQNSESLAKDPELRSFFQHNLEANRQNFAVLCEGAKAQDKTFCQRQLELLVTQESNIQSSESLTTDPELRSFFQQSLANNRTNAERLCGKLK